MQHVAVRPVDPSEVPDIVVEAVAIADGANLSDADRAVLLPAIFNVLTARAIFPAMPALTDARAILRAGGPIGI